MIWLTLASTTSPFVMEILCIALFKKVNPVLLYRLQSGVGVTVGVSVIVGVRVAVEVGMLAVMPL